MRTTPILQRYNLGGETGSKTGRGKADHDEKTSEIWFGGDWPRCALQRAFGLDDGLRCCLEISEGRTRAGDSERKRRGWWVVGQEAKEGEETNRHQVLSP